MPLLDVEDTILKLLGMQALSVSGCQLEGNQMVMFLRKKGGLVCPRCHTEHNSPVRDSQMRHYKCGLINSYHIVARVTIRRFFCSQCQILVREDVGLPEDKVSSLPVLNEFVTVLTEMMDNKAVARLTGLSEASVFRIDKANLQKRMQGYQDQVPPLEYVSVDEIAIRRGHNYCTVAVNLKDKKIVWIEPERRKDSLYKLMQHFPEQFSGVKALSMDLWQPYELAAKEFCPQAHIVYDKFHISRLLGRCIEMERRHYQKQLGVGSTWMTGSFEGSASFGSHTLTSSGESDIFAASIGPGTPLEEELHPPAVFLVLAASPNPFAATTAITLAGGIPEGFSGNAALDIFDLRGRKVRSLGLADPSPQGLSLNWDGRDEIGATCPNGIYLARIELGGWRATLKLSLIRQSP